MTKTTPVSGVITAAVTPLRPDFSPDPQAIPGLLDFLRTRGAHGVLLMGTTGEGPSFSPSERAEVLVAATAYRRDHPEFSILAGTGTPSLGETIELTRQAFAIGVDAVMVLPPYYFRKVSDDGLFAWYSQVIEQAVPAGAELYGYHIPAVSGVGLSTDLLARLKEKYPGQFAGIKDSTGDENHARLVAGQFGSALKVFTGNDRLFSLALDLQAAGCITALANLCTPWLRRLWDAHHAGESGLEFQDALNTARAVFEAIQPAPAVLKMMLHRKYHLPSWPVRPPLLPLPLEQADQAETRLNQVL